MSELAKEEFRGDREMYCRFCGNQLPDDSKFCSSCGRGQVKRPSVDKNKLNIKFLKLKEKGIISDEEFAKISCEETWALRYANKAKNTKYRVHGKWIIIISIILRLILSVKNVWDMWPDNLNLLNEFHGQTYMISSLVSGVIPSLLDILALTLLLYYIVYLHPRNNTFKKLFAIVILLFIFANVFSPLNYFDFIWSSDNGGSWEISISRIQGNSQLQLLFGMHIIRLIFLIVILYLIIIQNSGFKTFLMMEIGLTTIALVISGYIYISVYIDYIVYKDIFFDEIIANFLWISLIKNICSIMVSFLFNVAFFIYIYRNSFPFCPDYLYIVND